MNGDTCLLPTHAHCHTHPGSALLGFDNYFQLHKGSGAVEEMVEDIMKTRGRDTKRKRKERKESRRLDKTFHTMLCVFSVCCIIWGFEPTSCSVQLTFVSLSLCLPLEHVESKLNNFFFSPIGRCIQSRSSWCTSHYLFMNYWLLNIIYKLYIFNITWGMVTIQPHLAATAAVMEVTLHFHTELEFTSKMLGWRLTEQAVVYTKKVI